MVKCLFCKLYLEISSSSIQKDSGPDVFEAAQHYRRIFQQVRHDFPEIFGQDEELLLDPRNLTYVINELEFSLTEASTDPIGDAFEVFAGSESRARSGQFFTPKNATELLVKAIDPKPGERIIDPACGAGGFLASAARYFRLQGAAQDEVSAATQFLYGIEKDGYLAKLARLHVSLLTGGHPNVVCGDSLSLKTENGPLETAMPVSDYDAVLTNPPFGVKIIAATTETLRKFELAKKWRFDSNSERWLPASEFRVKVPPQILFVERCLSLLREGGRLGMVIPESVLSSKAYRYVVQYLREHATLEAVIGMPESLFKTSGKGGTHTKTCLLIARKGRITSSVRLFKAEAKWCGKDSRAREIPHDDLPTIGDNLKAFRRGNGFRSTHLGFPINEQDVNDNELCPRYYDPELEQELEKLSSSHELLRFGDLRRDGCLTVTTGDELGKLAYGTGSIPFVRTSDLSNWEIKADPKHCVSEEHYVTLKLKQDVRPNDLLMVKDGTYLIGTCALVTESDQRMLFQSHLYKIRVHDNSKGINPFLLLALLSCSLVQRQIRAKQFTQDIIDSLGERINELLLPVPKSKEKRKRITKMVQQVIEARLAARKLAMDATLEILR